MAATDAIHSVLCGSLATLAIIQGAMGLLGGLIIAALWEVVPGSNARVRWKRALIVGAVLAAVALVGALIMRPSVCV